MNQNVDPSTSQDSCRRIQERFSAWMDGEAAPGSGVEIHAHAHTCPRCRRDLRALSRVVLGTRAATRGEAAPRRQRPDRVLVEAVLARAGEACVRDLVRTGRGLLACRVLKAAAVDERAADRLRARLERRARALLAQVDGLRLGVRHELRDTVIRLLHAPDGGAPWTSELEEARRTLALESPPPPLPPVDGEARRAAFDWARTVLVIVRRR